MPQDQLAAPGLKPGQVRVRGVIERMQVVQPVEGRPVETEVLQAVGRVGIGGEGQVLQRAQGRAVAHHPAGGGFGHIDPAPGQLRSHLRSADGEVVTLRVMGTGVEPAGDLHLLGGQAGIAGRLARLAQGVRRIEMAGAGVGDLAVLQPVGGVAGRQRRGMQGRQLGRGQDRRAVGPVVREVHPGVIEAVLHLEVHGRGPRGDPVEVLREAFHLHQGLTPAVGTSGEVREFRRLAIVLVDQGLGRQRRQVDAAIGKVHPRLRIGAERSVAHVAALVPHVGGGERHGIVLDRGAGLCMFRMDLQHSAQAAAAGLQIALGPAADRKPKLEADVRGDGPLHLAEARAADRPLRRALDRDRSPHLGVDPRLGKACAAHRRGHRGQGLWCRGGRLHEGARQGEADDQDEGQLHRDFHGWGDGAANASPSGTIGPDRFRSGPGSDARRRRRARR